MGTHSHPIRGGNPGRPQREGRQASAGLGHCDMDGGIALLPFPSGGHCNIKGPFLTLFTL